MLSKEQAIINAIDVDELSEARDMITTNIFERISGRIEELKGTIKILEDDGDGEEYKKFFNAALKKFNVDSPADFDSDEEKKKFFDYIEKNWKGEKKEEEASVASESQDQPTPAEKWIEEDEGKEN